MTLKFEELIDNVEEETSSISFNTIQNSSGKRKKGKKLCVIVEAKIH